MHVKTSTLAATLLLVPLSVAQENGPNSRGQDTDRPNIVVILVDDLRWDSLGVAGHPFIESPNIDRLAREGALFRNAFVTTPLCSPARASFLTGRYARAHRVHTNDDRSALSHRLITFPRLLEHAGYDTAFVGKWHMGDDDAPRPGFTHWVGFRGQGAYRNQELNINGRRVPTDGYVTDTLNDYAEDFVRTAARGNRPFLLYLSHKAIHDPVLPPTRHEGLYNGARVPCSPGCKDTLEGKRALTRSVPGTRPPARGSGPADGNTRGRLSLLSAVDEGVGQLLKTLAEEGVLDQTAVVFTSDNGYFFREHGLGDKRWAYEEAIRIPLLLRYPPLARPGILLDELVLNVDLAPTLLDLAGVSNRAGFHGESFLPLLSEGATGWRDAFVAEYFDEDPFPRIPTWEAIRTERWKYMRYPDLGGEFDELYDLRTDPYELNNLAMESRVSDTLDSLIRRLEQSFESLEL